MGAQREGHREPTGVGSTAREDRTAGKVGKVSWDASALPHSEGAAYKRQSREVAACPRDWRMGSQYATMDRDNRTRTGAKDPWGREAFRLPDSGSWKHGRVRTPSRISVSVVEAGEGSMQTGRGGGHVGSRLNRDGVWEGAT